MCRIKDERWCMLIMSSITDEPEWSSRGGQGRKVVGVLHNARRMFLFSFCGPRLLLLLLMMLMTEGWKKVEISLEGRPIRRKTLSFLCLEQYESNLLQFLRLGFSLSTRRTNKRIRCPWGDGDLGGVSDGKKKEVCKKQNRSCELQQQELFPWTLFRISGWVDKKKDCPTME